MDPEAVEFRDMIGAVLRRVCAQNGFTPPSASECATLADGLHALVVERGLPPKLAPGDPGVAGGMAEESSAPLVARVMGTMSGPAEADAEARHELLSEAVKQLVKTCCSRRSEGDAGA